MGIRYQLDYLRQKSRETSFEELQEIGFVSRVKELLPQAWTPGCGLAGVQIGMPIRAAWYQVPEGKTRKENLLINPEIVELKHRFTNSKEGCLSIPNQWFQVKRYSWIRYLNDGKEHVASGFEAVVIQHEMDHMDGILTIDRAKTDAEGEKIGRNEPCFCGSGKKYKKCCLSNVTNP